MKFKFKEENTDGTYCAVSWFAANCYTQNLLYDISVDLKIVHCCYCWVDVNKRKLLSFSARLSADLLIYYSFVFKRRPVLGIVYPSLILLNISSDFVFNFSYGWYTVGVTKWRSDRNDLTVGCYSIHITINRLPSYMHGILHVFCDDNDGLIWWHQRWGYCPGLFTPPNHWSVKMKFGNKNRIDVVIYRYHSFPRLSVEQINPWIPPTHPYTKKHQCHPDLY